MLTVLRSSQRNWTSELHTATGRSAIAHLINILKPRTVMMPAYVPEGVRDPFLRAGVQIKYYKLRDDLRPDLDHVLKMITKECIFVLIHYFGYLTETGALREIVSGVGGTLFEDCAQALFAKADDADVALWSYNKFLPVVDGAVLKSRRRDIKLAPISISGDLGTLPSKVVNSYHQHLHLNARMAKLHDRTQVLDLERESQLAYEQYYSFIKDDLSIYAQSEESKCIIADTNHEGIKTIRSHNAQHYRRVIPTCFHFRSTDPIGPFAFPIVVRPPWNCERVFDILIENGMLPARQIDKWDHIPKGDPRFDIEHTFMDQHLLLPVGVEVSYNAVKRVGAALTRMCGEN